MNGKFVLAQVSDTHVRTDDGAAAVRQLRRALDQVRAYEADVIWMTGDLANDARAEEYAALKQALADSPAPVFLMPGNHDDCDLVRSTFPEHVYLPRVGPLSYALDQFDLRLVALDQTAPGETHGLLTNAQADWLDHTLAASPDRPTVLALHHPPFLTHDMLFDRIGLLNSDLLEAVVAKHRQVLRVICGHHHRVALGQIAHAPVVVAPSTSWVYGLALTDGQPIAPKTTEQPGWMLHVWTPNGGFASHFMGI